MSTGLSGKPKATSSSTSIDGQEFNQPRRSARLQKNNSLVGKNDNLSKRKRPLENSHDVTDGRKIVLDTETTGLSPSKGERLCEIACIEIDNNGLSTRKIFHTYVNPNRKMSRGAFKVHGLSNDFLQDKPLFKDVVDEFLKFIGNSPLVIHNAPFDIRFLNSELERANKPLINNEIIDTVKIARKQFPGTSVKLDALCERFDISLEDRTKHGALIDTELLAQVYQNLCQETMTTEEPIQKKIKHSR